MADAHLAGPVTLNGGGLCAASQYLLAPAFDRVTIAPGAGLLAESEVFVKFCGKTAARER